MVRLTDARVLALALAVPLLVGTGIAVWALTTSPLESAGPDAASVGEVSYAERTDSISTIVKLVPGESLTVQAQSAGLITKLGIAPNAVVENGDNVMEVNGSPVTAYVSETPLFRDVEQGVTGEDVEITQKFLADLGYLDQAPDGVVGAQTVAAIERFNEARGRGTTDGTLSLSSLLWVPPDARTPASVAVGVGTVLEPGTDLFVAVGFNSYFAVNVEASNDRRVLRVSDVEVDLEPGSNTIAEPEAVNRISEVMNGQESFPATVSLANPRSVGTVPSAAIVTDAHGAVCFFADISGPGTVIDPVSGSFGLVDVDVDLVGAPVLLNPRDVRGEFSCD